MSNSDTVKAIYAAFGRGDIQFIIDQLADDVEWDQWKDNYAQRADVAHLRYRKGRESIWEFFKEVEKMGITRLDVLSVMEGDGHVAADIYYESPKANEEEIHLWGFNDEGKVTRYRHYGDTAKQIAAYGNTSGSASA